MGWGQPEGEALPWLERGTESGAGTADEAQDIFLGSQQGALLFPFWENFLRAETALGEDGAVGLGLFHGVLPLGF